MMEAGGFVAARRARHTLQDDDSEGGNDGGNTENVTATKASSDPQCGCGCSMQASQTPKFRAAMPHSLAPETQKTKMKMGTIEPLGETRPRTSLVQKALHNRRALYAGNEYAKEDDIANGKTMTVTQAQRKPNDYDNVSATNMTR